MYILLSSALAGDVGLPGRISGHSNAPVGDKASSCGPGVGQMMVPSGKIRGDTDRSPPPVWPES